MSPARRRRCCCSDWLVVGRSSGGVAVDGQQAVVVGAGGDAEGVAGTDLRLGALPQTLTVEESPYAAPTAFQSSSVRSYGVGMSSGCAPIRHQARSDAHKMMVYTIAC